MSCYIKILTSFFFLALLSSCASPEQQAAERQQQLAQSAQRQRVMIERLSAKCQQYGFQQGTNAFANCLQQAEQQEDMNNALMWQQQQQSYQQIQNGLNQLGNIDNVTREQFKNAPQGGLICVNCK